MEERSIEAVEERAAREGEIEIGLESRTEEQKEADWRDWKEKDREDSSRRGEGTEREGKAWEKSPESRDEAGYPRMERRARRGYVGERKD